MGGFVHRRNRIALVLHPAEAEILAGLLGQLLDLVVPAEPLDDDPLSALIGIGSTTEPPQDPVLARLFPDAYGDDLEASGEFRRYTEPELRERKRIQAETALATLGPSADGDQGFALTDEEAQAWLLALNDLRLALGTRLGVTEEVLAEPLPDEGDPSRPLLEVYDWLTWLQGGLVEALS